MASWTKYSFLLKLHGCAMVTDFTIQPFLPLIASLAPKGVGRPGSHCLATVPVLFGNTGPL
jgi:hypothetical protein